MLGVWPAVKASVVIFISSYFKFPMTKRHACLLSPSRLAAIKGEQKAAGSLRVRR